MQAAEKGVERLTAEIAKLDALLGVSPTFYADAAKAQRIAMERGQAAKAASPRRRRLGSPRRRPSRMPRRKTSMHQFARAAASRRDEARGA